MIYDMTTFMPEIPYDVEEFVQDPDIRTVASGDRYGEFVVEPLEPGHGITLGNPLRRILYGGLEGAAITCVRIRGVERESDPLANVAESLPDILLNIRSIRIRFRACGTGQGSPGGVWRGSGDRRRRNVS